MTTKFYTSRIECISMEIEDALGEFVDDFDVERFADDFIKCDGGYYSLPLDPVDFWSLMVNYTKSSQEDQEDTMAEFVVFTHFNTKTNDYRAFADDGYIYCPYINSIRAANVPEAARAAYKKLLDDGKPCDEAIKILKASWVKCPGDSIAISVANLNVIDELESELTDTKDKPEGVTFSFRCGDSSRCYLHTWSETDWTAYGIGSRYNHINKALCQMAYSEVSYDSARKVIERYGFKLESVR